jgi:carboxylesterase
MRWAGEDLSRRGHTVLGIRLAGHATSIENLDRTTWEDWLTSVEDGLNLLKTCTDQQFLIGLSMGGALSLLAAARYPFSGVVTISAISMIKKDRRAVILPLLRRTHYGMRKGKPDWHNPEGPVGHISYNVYPGAGLFQLTRLLKELAEELPNISMPALLIHSRVDGAVPIANLEFINQRIGTKDKEILIVENSGHVITREPDRFEVFERIHQFIQRVIAQT